MRIRYIGMDNRLRVAEASHVKFMEDGFQETDKINERQEGIFGPVIVAHVYRSKGMKRLTIQAPEGFDMVRAEADLLERGWLDLAACKVVGENLY